MLRIKIILKNNIIFYGIALIEQKIGILYKIKGIAFLDFFPSHIKNNY